MKFQALGLAWYVVIDFRLKCKIHPLCLLRRVYVTGGSWVSRLQLREREREREREIIRIGFLGF